MVSSTARVWILSTILFFAVNAEREKHSIFWNSSSETFIDHEEPVLTVKIMGTVDFHCPFYNDTVTRDEAEYSFIYSVSEKGYENCESEDTKPIGMCQSPFSKAITTIVFREYSPLPNGIDYRPGQTYYFISTSDGTEAGLHNKNGGLCAKANMRLKVKIAPRDEEGAAETVEPKSGASSMDGRGISTQDDPDGESAISKSGASSAIRKQYATGRRQLTSDTKTTISDTVDGESSNEEAEDKDSIGINFVVDDNKLQPTPLAASAGKNAQLDGSTGALVYDPYGLEPSNSVKRDRQSSESWRNTKGRPGRYQPVEDKSFILYEIHEMEPQRINRYAASSASSSRISWITAILVFVIALTMARWGRSL